MCFGEWSDLAIDQTCGMFGQQNLFHGSGLWDPLEEAAPQSPHPLLAPYLVLPEERLPSVEGPSRLESKQVEPKTKLGAWSQP